MQEKKFILKEIQIEEAKNTKYIHGRKFYEIIYVNGNPAHAKGESAYFADKIDYGNEIFSNV